MDSTPSRSKKLENATQFDLTTCERLPSVGAYVASLCRRVADAGSEILHNLRLVLAGAGGAGGTASGGTRYVAHTSMAPRQRARLLAPGLPTVLRPQVVQHPRDHASFQLPIQLQQR